jgi:hypothetical protein
MGPSYSASRPRTTHVTGDPGFGQDVAVMAEEKDEHMPDWADQAHAKDPKGTGCFWRHVDYKNKKYPRCNYRKNAHDYSKASEAHIYNVPTLRSPQRWVDAWLEDIKPTLTKPTPTEAGKVRAGSEAQQPLNGAWDLGRGKNFTTWMMPWWHNTHHVIACGEFSTVFSKEDEQKLILATKWNINEMPNVIILPKQFVIARILKVPTHVPPDGAQNHTQYSTRLSTKLNAVRGKLAKAADGSGHPVTEENAPAVRADLEKASKALRDFLIKAGEKNPGVNLDNLSLDSVSW